MERNGPIRRHEIRYAIRFPDFPGFFYQKFLVKKRVTLTVAYFRWIDNEKSGNQDTRVKSGKWRHWWRHWPELLVGQLWVYNFLSYELHFFSISEKSDRISDLGIPAFWLVNSFPFISKKINTPLEFGPGWGNDCTPGVRSSSKSSSSFKAETIYQSGITWIIGIPQDRDMVQVSLN